MLPPYMVNDWPPMATPPPPWASLLLMLLPLISPPYMVK